MLLDWWPTWFDHVSALGSWDVGLQSGEDPSYRQMAWDTRSGKSCPRRLLTDHALRVQQVTFMHCCAVPALRSRLWWLIWKIQGSIPVPLLPEVVWSSKLHPRTRRPRALQQAANRSKKRRVVPRGPTKSGCHKSATIYKSRSDASKWLAELPYLLEFYLSIVIVSGCFDH